VPTDLYEAYGQYKALFDSLFLVYSVESIDKRIRLYEKDSFKLEFKNPNCCFKMKHSRYEMSFLSEVFIPIIRSANEL